MAGAGMDLVTTLWSVGSLLPRLWLAREWWTGAQDKRQKEEREAKAAEEAAAAKAAEAAAAKAEAEAAEAVREPPQTAAQAVTGVPPPSKETSTEVCLFLMWACVAFACC